MDFPKKQQQCLIPRYLLQYLTSLEYNHTDPTAEWGSEGVIYTAGTGIDITDDAISLDTTPDTFEITANTGITLMTENQNPVYKDAKLLLAYTGATRLEGTDVSIEANSIHFNSDSAPWYVNNTTHEYKVLATTDQIPSLVGYATEDWVSTELLNYAELSDLSTVATTGDYDDLLNKPTIPTDTSDLTNGAGYITSSALTGYATETWVTNQGYSTFSGNYNDLTNKPNLATVATSGNYNDLINKPNLNNYVTTNTEQNITKVKTIYNTSNGHSDIYFKAPLNDNSSNTMGFSAFDYSDSQIGGLQIMNRTLQFNSDESSTYYYGTFLTNFRSNSNSLNTVTGFRVLPSDTYSGSYSINFVAPFGTRTDLYNIYKSNSNVNTVNLVAAITDGTNTVLANKLGVVDISSLLPSAPTYTAGTGIDITNNAISIDNTVALKSEIPTVPTNVSAFTNDAGYITSSALSGYVTTDTDQDITGIKTFTGEKKLAFKQSANLDVIGFTAYNNNNVEIGNLQVASRLVGGNRYNYVTLGNYSSQSSKSKLGFRVQPNSSSMSYNFVMPYGTQGNFNTIGYSTAADNTIPCAFTDGTNTIKANTLGLVDLSTLNIGGGPTITRYTGYKDYPVSTSGSLNANFIMYSSTLDNFLNINDVNEGDYLEINIKYSWVDRLDHSFTRYETIKLYIPPKSPSSSDDIRNYSTDRRIYETTDKNENFFLFNPYAPTQVTTAGSVVQIGSFVTNNIIFAVTAINRNYNTTTSTYDTMSITIMSVDHYAY